MLQAYLEGVAPSARASVHSKVTINLTPFFFAQTVTERVPTPCGATIGVDCTKREAPRKEERNCIVLHCIVGNIFDQLLGIAALHCGVFAFQWLSHSFAELGI